VGGGLLAFGSLADPNYFGKFYARRVLRIFPLYYGVLAILSVVALASGVSWHRELFADWRFWACAPFTFSQELLIRWQLRLILAKVQFFFQALTPDACRSLPTSSIHLFIGPRRGWIDLQISTDVSFLYSQLSGVITMVRHLHPSLFLDPLL
jgi:hypothetical protein